MYIMYNVYYVYYYVCKYQGRFLILLCEAKLTSLNIDISDQNF